MLLIKQTLNLKQDKNNFMDNENIKYQNNFTKFVLWELLVISVLVLMAIF